MQHTWVSLLPARIGYSACLDSATAALVAACRYRRGSAGVSLEAALKALGSALSILNAQLSSAAEKTDDWTLASVAVLSSAAACRSRHSMVDPSHVDGLTTLLTLHPADLPVSEIGKGVCDYHLFDSFISSVVKQLLSRLEELPPSFYLPPAGAVQPPGTRLKAVGNMLYVHLPRLIGLIRQSKGSRSSGVAFSLVDTAKMIRSAGSLAAFEDEAAESALSHRLSITESSDSPYRGLSKWSFVFRCPAECDAAASYWMTRINILRLCLRIWETDPEACCQHSGLPSKGDALKEIDLLARNILMSAQYAQTQRARKRRRLLAHAMVACWEWLQDCSVQRRNDSRSPCELRHCLIDSQTVL